MGVPGVYKLLITKYQREVLKQIIELKDNKKILYFDFNCLIHLVVNMLLEEKDDKVLLFSTIYKEIVKCSKRIIDLVKPEYTYIMIDGMVPRFKMKQQRLRRFKSEKNKKFDRNAISPGTEFMKGLSDYLNKNLKNNKISISDDSEQGEGEHKLFKILRNDNSDNIHIIYSLDADLIMLGLSEEKQIYILREKQNCDKKLYNYIENMEELHYLDISSLKNRIYTEQLNNEDRLLKSVQYITKDEYMNDVLFLLFMLGNDFVPHTKLFNIYKGGWELIINGYLNILNKYKKPLVKKLDINWDFLVDILYKCIENENYIVKRNSNKFDLKVIGYGINKKWKENHNIKYFKSNDIEKRFEICGDYIKTLVWTLSYYKSNEIPSWRFYYKYDYGPLVSDIIEYLMYIDEEIIIEKDEPYTPQQQLVMILPYHSKNLLKEENQKYIDNELEEYYPISFKLEKLNKVCDWQYEPILPEIDDKIIMKYIN
jgi:5'-3' exonuclease